jgi:hypothetical protein
MMVNSIRSPAKHLQPTNRASSKAKNRLNEGGWEHPPPRFATTEKLFWVMLSRLWASWRRVLILFQPETVVRWHRTGFKL